MGMLDRLAARAAGVGAADLATGRSPNPTLASTPDRLPLHFRPGDRTGRPSRSPMAPSLLASRSAPVRRAWGASPRADAPPPALPPTRPVGDVAGPPARATARPEEPARAPRAPVAALPPAAPARDAPDVAGVPRQRTEPVPAAVVRPADARPTPPRSPLVRPAVSELPTRPVVRQTGPEPPTPASRARPVLAVPPINPPAAPAVPQPSARATVGSMLRDRPPNLRRQELPPARPQARRSVTVEIGRIDLAPPPPPAPPPVVVIGPPRDALAGLEAERGWPERSAG